MITKTKVVCRAVEKYLLILCIANSNNQEPIRYFALYIKAK